MNCINTYYSAQAASGRCCSQLSDVLYLLSLEIRNCGSDEYVSKKEQTLWSRVGEIVRACEAVGRSGWDWNAGKDLIHFTIMILSVFLSYNFCPMEFGIYHRIFRVFMNCIPQKVNLSGFIQGKLMFYLKRSNLMLLLNM